MCYWCKRVWKDWKLAGGGTYEIATGTENHIASPAQYHFKKPIKTENRASSPGVSFLA